MKDAYSADRDQAGLDASYEAQYGAYVRTFERLGLETVVGRVGRRDHGRQPGPRVHGPQPGRRGRPRPVRVGRITPPTARSRSCPSRAAPARRGRRCPLEEVATPGTTTIATLAAFLGIGAERTAKAAFFVTGDGRLVTAIVRGDYEVNETKLANAVKAVGGIRPATVEEIKAAGMEPGYGSPIGAHGTVVVIDDLVAALAEPRRRRQPRGLPLPQRQRRPRLHGRRRRRHHQRPGRRRLPGLRRAGHPAQRHRGRQHLQARDEVHATRPAPRYLGEDGVAHPIVMGSYGIGVGRNVACIVEAHHDEKGIVWPAEVAPYAAHLVSIGGGQGAARRRDRREPPPARARRRPRDPVGRPRRVARASSSPMRSCSGCPGS